MSEEEGGFDLMTLANKWGGCYVEPTRVARALLVGLERQLQRHTV